MTLTEGNAQTGAWRFTVQPNAGAMAAKSSMAAAANVAYQYGQALVTVTLHDSGNAPVAGVSVAFSVSGTDAAIVAPDAGGTKTLATDALGQAVVAVTKASPGSAVVTASWLATTVPQSLQTTVTFAAYGTTDSKATSGWTIIAPGAVVRDLHVYTGGGVPSGLPAGTTLPYGLAAFSIGVASGATTTLTVTAPGAIGSKSKLWKFLPTCVAGAPTTWAWVDFTNRATSFDDANPTYYVTLTDGGPGDADCQANGVIVDPQGPGFNPADVPTLAEWAAIALLLIMAAYAAWRLRKNAALGRAALGVLVLLSGSTLLAGIATSALSVAGHDPSANRGDGQTMRAPLAPDVAMSTTTITAHLEAQAGDTLTGAVLRYRKSGDPWILSAPFAPASGVCADCWTATLPLVGFGAASTVEYYVEADFAAGKTAFLYDGDRDLCTGVDCGAHGTCLDGGCVCDTGWKGAACETQAFTITYSAAATHGIVEGTVTDVETDAPISGVTVTCGALQFETLADGQYSLDVPAGHATVVFSHPDYIQLSVEAGILSEPMVYDVELQKRAAAVAVPPEGQTVTAGVATVVFPAGAYAAPASVSANWMEGANALSATDEYFFRTPDGASKVVTGVLNVEVSSEPGLAVEVRLPVPAGATAADVALFHVGADGQWSDPLAPTHVDGGFATYLVDHFSRVGQAAPNPVYYVTTMVKGDVTVNGQPVHKGDVIPDGAIVITGPNGRGIIKDAAGGSMYLSPNTVVTVDHTPAPAGGGDVFGTTVSECYGRLRNWVEKNLPGESAGRIATRLHLPNATYGVRGTVAGGSCDGSTSSTTIEVPTGTVDIESVDSEPVTGVSVTGGQTATVAPTTACVPTGPEICNGIDDDCNGLTDAEDPALVMIDLRLCENQKGACMGATKPASLCVGGGWSPCTAAVYAAHSPDYQASDPCDGIDRNCDGLDCP